MKLRVLLIEDSAEDAELVSKELSRGGFEVEALRVDDRDAVVAALATAKWDLVISDYAMPRFSGRLALALLAERCPELPFLIVSGTIGEDTAVEAMRAGAQDFFVKGKLARLVPAVERALADAKAKNESRRLREQLALAERMSTLGGFAAGVVHEIKTPLQFVGDSVRFLDNAARDMLSALRALDGIKRLALAGVAASELREAAERADTALRETDIDYATERVPDAIARCLEGLSHVDGIIQAMKELSHPGQAEMVAADINRAVKSALVLARSEYKHVADVETELGALPPVVCHASYVNQAVLNLIVNAAHAIADVDRPGRGKLTVRTAREGGNVVISVRDTGVGIPAELHERVFEPSFTTKEVGRGSGRGLAIARAIVEKHGGSITFETALGIGTTFFIRLPIAGAPAHAAAEGTP